MKIFIGSDHNGHQLKDQLAGYLKRAGYTVNDDGDAKSDPTDDFPVFAAKVAHDVILSEDEDPRGILICGSGQGMCMAANRFKGIRACLGWDNEAVRSSRNDDDSNVLCLPARVLKGDNVFDIVDVWLNTPFENAPRFVRRNREMDKLV
jgi:ribose 5-phosphate isomerase B